MLCEIKPKHEQAAQKPIGCFVVDEGGGWTLN